MTLIFCHAALSFVNSRNNINRINTINAWFHYFRLRDRIQP